MELYNVLITQVATRTEAIAIHSKIIGYSTHEKAKAAADIINNDCKPCDGYVTRHAELLP